MEEEMCQDSNILIRLVWHRKGDLRLNDNELYHRLQEEEENEKIVSLYVVNPADYEPRLVTGQEKNNLGQKNSLGTVTEGPHASRALIDALTELRSNLRALGGDLLVRRGDPLQIVPAMAQAWNARQVMWSELPGSYEQKQSDKMKDSLLGMQTGVQITIVESYTLFHPDDLPRGEEAWSRLARPNQKVSKKKKKRKGNRNTDNQQPQTPAIPQQSLLLSEVDCKPSRWIGIPRIMGEFRRAARTAAPVRPCFPAPCRESIHQFATSADNQTNHDSGDLPTMKELTCSFQGKSLFGLSPRVIDTVIRQATCSQTPAGTFGEFKARQSWDEFLTLHAASANRSLADTSNHQSAHISTALALGVVSPRHIYWSVKKLQQEQPAKAEAVQWLTSHMEMRDHFLYSAFALGDQLYHLTGHAPVHKSKQRRHQKQNQSSQNETLQVWKPINVGTPSHHLFCQWATGQTGLPLVDAGMKELQNTGYCSNRVRQNMASVLTKDLCLDWRAGAEWFQFCLADHCVAANWGNWRYFGGVGGDPKNRHFRTVSQALKYDANGEYVTKWLFQHTSRKRQIRGDGMTEEEATEALLRPWDFDEGWDTIVDPETQYTWHDKERLEKTGMLVQNNRDMGQEDSHRSSKLK